MWYTAAKNRSIGIGGGIVRQKMNFNADVGPVVNVPEGYELPSDPDAPTPPWMMTTEERLGDEHTNGFMAGYTPDSLNNSEQSKSSFIPDQHPNEEGESWQEYTPEEFA